MIKYKLMTLGILLVLGFTLIASGCGTATTEPSTGLANPASVYCEEQGYRLEMRADPDGGTYGVCIFLDGSECEEWAFYRGDCQPPPAAEVPVQPTEDVPPTEPPAEEQPTEVPAPTPTDIVVQTPEQVDEGNSLSKDSSLATVPQPASSSGTESWQSYENGTFAYTLLYPADATLLESPQGTGVQITGPLVDNERWPIMEITHFDSDFYHPPAGTDVAQWVADFILAYDEIDTAAVIAGLPAVHLTTNATEQAYGFDEYYVIKGEQLFRINIIHAAGQEDWNVYNAFLESFTSK